MIPARRWFDPDAVRATFWGLLAAVVLIASIYGGSRGLRDFDAALVPYAGATVFATFGLAYRYAMWLRRPPTRMYWSRGWQLFFRPRSFFRNLAYSLRSATDDMVLQRFIERRSPLRWAAHFLIAWGCLLAAAVTFPLSFGWVRFETAPASQQLYYGFVFGQHVLTFKLGTPLAVLVFNLLDVAAVMVLAGLVFAFWRRARDRGALSVQQFANDLLPLLMLFAISVTGIFLTVSTHLLHGLHYAFLSQLHAVTVIFTLIYLPFGKFFHIFQRPAQQGVKVYKRVGHEGEHAVCASCHKAFASLMHIRDLKEVEAQLGIRYQFDPSIHYQDLCPSCRRKNLALTQDFLWRSERLGAGAVD